jgi:hypothetical protein
MIAAMKMSSRKHEHQIDFWSEQRGEVAVLVGQLLPGEALEILKRVVMECTEGQQAVPMLLGTIRGGPNARWLIATTTGVTD